MGFPFFTPIYIKNTKLEVYGPVSFEEDSLDSVVGGQLQYKYFPVNMGQLEADIHYERLKEQEIDLGDGIKLTTKYLNHPITVLGYKFEYQGKIFCTAYDHEPFSNIFDVSKDDPVMTRMPSGRERSRQRKRTTRSRPSLRGRTSWSMTRNTRTRSTSRTRRAGGTALSNGQSGQQTGQK